MPITAASMPGRQLPMRRFVAWVATCHAVCMKGRHGAKERVILFSDAVYAIVLTLMVIDILIAITGGDIDWRALAGTIGIYLVSFCFVVNLWFQTAQAFERVTAIPNGPLMVYPLSLFPPLPGSQGNRAHRRGGHSTDGAGVWGTHAGVDACHPVVVPVAYAV